MKTISFKVSESEARRIRLAARREGVTVSEYLRRRAVEGQPPASITKVRCPYTNAEIFGPLPDAPPLSTKRVREILADFP